MYNVVPIYLLLEVCMSLRNHLPYDADDGYFHHSELVMQHDNNYLHYDSYSSEEVMMHNSPRQSRLRSGPRSRSNRHIDFSDEEYHYRCKCSCTRCEKQKRKPKPCCEKFCSTQCVIPNNILVVPYPVPFIVPPPSSDLPITPIPTQPPTTPTTTTTTTTESTTTTECTTTTVTEISTYSTVPLYQNHINNKRFQILSQNLRRSMGNHGLHSSKYGRLPKYGIVPIPENLAQSLMYQLRKDQNNDQFRSRVALNKNLFDYTSRPIAQ